MSTAHEVLAEVKAARISDEAREDAQKKLFRRCWCPRYLMVVLSILAGISFAHLALLGAQYVKDPAHIPLVMVVVAFANLALAIGTIIVRLKMRSAALAELIRQKAPSLYDELLLDGVL